MISPKEEEVIRLISPLKFHRLFTLPATENHGALKVSYSIAGPENGDILTILFIGGMFCTRWYSIGYEYLAQKEGVRILLIDRFVFDSSLQQPGQPVNSPRNLDAKIYQSLLFALFSRDLPRFDSPIFDLPPQLPSQTNTSTDPASEPQPQFPLTKEYPPF
jgi:hypothetical protein